MLAPSPPSASRLLRVEHAVAEALLAAPSLEDAFARLLAAIGDGLGWQYGGLWLPVDGLRCVATWTEGGEALEAFAATSRALTLAPGEGLPGRVQACGRPIWIPSIAADANFPRAPRRPRPACTRRSRSRSPASAERSSSSPPGRRRSTRTCWRRSRASAGSSGQFVEHRRAESAVRESEARKRAMLDAALDAVITIDADGRIVEVNAAVEAIFGHPPAALVGRELGEALVPPALRDRHREGLARGSGRLLGSASRSPRCTRTGTSSRSS